MKRVDLISCSCWLATEDFSYGSANLRLAESEIGVVRIGAVIHRVAALEDSSRRHASTEESFEARFGGDRVVLIGDVDPTLNIGLKAKRLWP
jgi:hypothetical protein